MKAKRPYSRKVILKFNRPIDPKDLRQTEEFFRVLQDACSKGKPFQIREKAADGRVVKEERFPAHHGHIPQWIRHSRIRTRLLRPDSEGHPRVEVAIV
jgi:hypothetical protein